MCLSDPDLHWNWVLSGALTLERVCVCVCLSPARLGLGSGCLGGTQLLNKQVRRWCPCLGVNSCQVCGFSCLSKGSLVSDWKPGRYYMWHKEGKGNVGWWEGKSPADTFRCSPQIDWNLWCNPRLVSHLWKKWIPWYLVMLAQYQEQILLWS